MVDSYMYIVMVLVALVMVPISALILHLVTKMFKFEKESYVSALIVVGVTSVVSLVVNLITSFMSLNPIIAIVLSLVSFIMNILVFVLLGNRFYAEGVGRMLLAWLVWLVLSMLIGLVVGVVVGLVAFSIGFAGRVF